MVRQNGVHEKINITAYLIFLEHFQDFMFGLGQRLL